MAAIKSRWVIWEQPGDPEKVRENLDAYAKVRDLVVGDTVVSTVGGVSEIKAEVSGNPVELEHLGVLAYLRLPLD